MSRYHSLNAIIARTRAAHHVWSILSYNCNDFVADVARGLGTQTPTMLSLPYNFISRLEAMNGHKPPLVLPSIYGELIRRALLMGKRFFIAGIRLPLVAPQTARYCINSRLPRDVCIVFSRRCSGAIYTPFLSTVGWKVNAPVIF